MFSVEIGRVGKILSGKETGWTVKVEDDFQSAGGFLILISSPDNMSGFDAWVESKEALELYFQECEWEVEWL